MTGTLATFGKALFAAAIAFLGAIVTVLVGDTGLGDLTDGQWATAILAALIAAGGVWNLPYRPLSR